MQIVWPLSTSPELSDGIQHAYVSLVQLWSVQPVCPPCHSFSSLLYNMPPAAATVTEVRHSLVSCVVLAGKLHLLNIVELFYCVDYYRFCSPGRSRDMQDSSVCSVTCLPRPQLCDGGPSFPCQLCYY